MKKTRQEKVGTIIEDLDNKKSTIKSFTEDGNKPPKLEYKDHAGIICRLFVVLLGVTCIFAIPFKVLILIGMGGIGAFFLCLPIGILGLFAAGCRVIDITYDNIPKNEVEDEDDGVDSRLAMHCQFMQNECDFKGRELNFVCGEGWKLVFAHSADCQLVTAVIVGWKKTIKFSYSLDLSFSQFKDNFVKELESHTRIVSDTKETE